MTEPTKEARLLAERYRVPDFISLAREIDAFAAQRVAEEHGRILLTLHDKLPYPTEACAIVRSLAQEPRR